MPILVPLLRQPAGSNSCLPTAVRAVLLGRGLVVSSHEVSVWCRETDRGCWFDAAIEGLREADLDVEDLTGAAASQIAALVSDPDNPQPVIVTIAPEALGSGLVVLLPTESSTWADHAVVLTSAGDESVRFMDPLVGCLEEARSTRF